MENNYLIITDEYSQFYGWIGELNFISDGLVNHSFRLNNISDITNKIEDVKFITEEQYTSVYNAIINYEDENIVDLVNKVIDG